jgi:metal-dependent amidase/aminoacylase/carboxypeptidase family protein
LRINTRAFSVRSRNRTRAAIERIINAECQAAGSPKPPLIEETGSFPLLYNDEAVTEVISQAFEAHFGKDFDPNLPISMGSEDFANLADPISAPGCFWNYGGIDQGLWDDAERRGKLEEIPSTSHGQSDLQIALQKLNFSDRQSQPILRSGTSTVSNNCY